MFSLNVLQIDVLQVMVTSSKAEVEADEVGFYVAYLCVLK